MIRDTAGVGVVFLDRQSSVVVEQPVEDVRRLARVGGNHLGIEGAKLVRDVGVERDAWLVAMARVHVRDRGAGATSSKILPVGRGRSPSPPGGGKRKRPVRSQVFAAAHGRRVINQRRELARRRRGELPPAGGPLRIAKRAEIGDEAHAEIPPALLQTFNEQAKGSAGRTPSLLVAPASLLANWALEAARFTPRLKVVIAHPSFQAADELGAMSDERLAKTDLVVTSYGTLLRQSWIGKTSWGLAVLDEAQAIKNPNAKQTRAVKSLKAKARIVLTGTPIENNLRDLWSIFDFVNPGLLGSAKAFTQFAKTLASQPHISYAPLRRLVQPYILRRLKTDKSIIADLPDKTEVKAFCHLTRKQAALYQAAVAELEENLKQSGDGIARRGLVLSSLMRLKQICNHPSQWLGDGAYDESDSGKFERLREIGETIASRQEKLLVFTQFKEIIPSLERLLTAAFRRPGLVLHGDTPIAKRRDLVKTFQEDERTPFFVLSIKAGGSGLNLTSASHVVHFDRWWNPAVESQATDRAYRIGQRRNVLVHKFVCRGTIEAKIDLLIESKRQLADDFLAAGAEINLTEMDDRELLRLVALDLNAAMTEGAAS